MINITFTQIAQSVLIAAVSCTATMALISDRTPAIGFDTETWTMYRFKLSAYSKEYYAVYLNATPEGEARVCSPYAWRNRTQNPDGTFEVEGAFTVPMKNLYK